MASFLIHKPRFQDKLLMSWSSGYCPTRNFMKLLQRWVSLTTTLRFHHFASILF